MIHTLDLFSGAGGFTLGLENSGMKSIGAIELDRFAAETFQSNFKDVPMYNRDIYTFDNTEIKNLFSGVDIIAGGPPCQGFSVAGPSQYGIIDKRNSLIMEFFRFIDVLRPTVCILENVKGILNGKLSKDKRALDEYINALSSIGYTSKVFVLQTADFGVPQFRERVIVVAAKNPKYIPESIIGAYEGRENWISVGEAFGDLPIINAGEGTEELIGYTRDPITDYEKWIRMDSLGVTNHVAMKHTKRVIERFKNIPQGCSLKDAPPEYGQRARNGTEIDVRQRFKMNNQRLDPTRVSSAITASFQSNFIHPTLHRNLTAREGARLQSFPDKFIFCGPRTLMSKSLLEREGRSDEIGLSQYNQIGNAVPPRLGEGIGKTIIELLK